MSTPRRAWCNQVTTMIRSPTAIPSSASAKRSRTSSQASGAPSTPCLGAFERFVSRERMVPIDVSRGRVPDGSPTSLPLILVIAVIRATVLTGRAEGNGVMPTHAHRMGSPAGHSMRGWRVSLFNGALLLAFAIGRTADVKPSGA